MEILVLVFSSFVAALVAPALTRAGTKTAGWLLAVVPAGLVVLLSLYSARIWSGETILFSTGLALTFRLDGLSLQFALLSAACGAVILGYASSYLANTPDSGRFFSMLLLLTGSMIGVALSENLLLLYVFLELASLITCVLIRFGPDQEASRRAAMRAFIILSTGGLALLSGILVLRTIAGSLEFSHFAAHASAISSHRSYSVAMALLLIGAFAKSAQFPFHFWLIGTTRASTPVSAYVHSAGTAIAGIFVLARLTPLAGSTEEWFYTVTAVGGFTMLFGAIQGLRKKDLNEVLAYATVSALGILVLLIGLGTQEAATAAAIFLVAHAFYKCALWMIAGNIEQETGTREIGRLGRLARQMPATAVAGILSAMSMGSIPLTVGFAAQEKLFQAAESAPVHVPVFVSAVVAGSVLLFVLAGIAGFRPFFARHPSTEHAHEAPVAMWLLPLLLAVCSAAAGCAPWLLAGLVHSAAAAVTSDDVAMPQFRTIPVVTPTFLLSLGAIAAGLSLYLVHRWIPRSSGKETNLDTESAL